MTEGAGQKVQVEIVPITLAAAKAFVSAHHRHNKAPIGHKFSIGIQLNNELMGVAMAGRPVARHLDDGRTIEVSRTCTLGQPNLNSMLYGAIWRAAKAMGYKRAITYTQQNESGISLLAAGWIKKVELQERGSWADHSVHLRHKKDPIGSGGVARIRWQISSLKSQMRFVSVR